MLPSLCDYRREYDELGDEILAAVDGVFKSGQLILGPEGIAFERDMATYVGVSGGVGVNSGTDAIYIALAAAGVTAGDEVITVPNTAVPTVSAIQVLGARPVFVDIRDDDFLMDVDQIEASISPRTRAIVPVHLYGQCLDLHPRLDEVHAAILALNLPRIDGWIGRRRDIASRYRQGFAGSGLRLPKENSYGRHVYHLFVVETPGDRDAALQRIEARGLKCGVQYRWPIHLMRGYQDLGYRAGQFPVAEKKAQRIFSLPIDLHLK